MTLLAAAPALPLHSAGKYVAGAYVVFLALILIYVGIMAVRVSNNEREITALKQELLERQEAEEREREPVA
jgi:hypothetical protein